MNLQENIQRIKEVMGVINESKTIKDFLFSYWAKNGFENTILKKALSINANEWKDYVKEYLGDDYETVIKKDIVDYINNFTECDGDVFNLRVMSVHFGGGTWQDTSYAVNLKINMDSPVLQTVNLEDWEEVLTLTGQLEDCVESYLNDVIWEKYGAFNHHALLQII